MRNALVPAICIAACIAFAGCSVKGSGPAALTVYCGSSMREPMQELAKAYTEKTGVPVRLSFGDSGELLIQAERAKAGDAFVVHDPFSQMATAKGLIAETKPLATMSPAIGVKTGTKGEQEVKDLADLAKPDLKIGVPDPKYATAGNILAAQLAKAGITDAVMSRKGLLVSRSSGDLVNALDLGTVDVIVAWDSLIHRKKGLKAIPIDAKYQVDAVTSATSVVYPVKFVNITCSTLKSAKAPAAAKAFLDFASSPEQRAVFQKYAFSPVP